MEPEEEKQGRGEREKTSSRGKIRKTAVKRQPVAAERHA